MPLGGEGVVLYKNSNDFVETKVGKHRHRKAAAGTFL